MSKSAVECRRGRALPTAGASPAHAGVAWRTTTSAAVLAKAAAQELASSGALPDPRELLLVRLRPGKAAAWSVTLKVLYARREAEPREYGFIADAARLDDEGALDVAFAFVSGPEAMDGLAFPGVTLVDVTDGRSSAPVVEVSGFGAGPIPIELERREGGELKLRLRLRDFLGRPVAGRPCTVDVGGDPRELTLDGDGVVERPVDADAAGSLTAGDLTADFLVGRLEPADTVPGARERLANLGYLDDPDDDDAATLAVEDFQIDEGLEASGQLDDATRARLVQAHGC